jgi:hypothetical protein
MIAFTRGCLAAVIAVVVLAPAPLDAQAPRSEYEIKAAYLYTFGRFVEWPPRAPVDASAFTICVLGSDPFGSVLDRTLAGGTIRGRAVGARRLVSIDEAPGCQIVFVSASEERRVGPIIESLRPSGVLTVSDMPQFATRGGMIQFVTASNRVRFQINLQPARDAGLMMSSELLRVASAVLNPGRGGQ